MSEHVRIGTRGSDLALWQTRDVAHKLGVPSSEVLITTTGDVNMADQLAGTVEKGFFTRELDEALLRGDVDITVHSLKDLPTRLPAGIALAAVLPREVPHDVLLIHQDALDEARGTSMHPPLAPGTRVGSSSLRRQALVKHFFPTLQAVPLRGNVPTRIQRVRERTVDAILLAAAGVTRLANILDMTRVHTFALSPWRWPGAPGQGAVGVTCRATDDRMLSLLAPLHNDASAASTSWERDVLRVLEGGCSLPFGCYAGDASSQRQHAVAGLFDGGQWRTSAYSLSTSAHDVAHALRSAHFVSQEMTDEPLIRRV
jgi:hydroxymethylbilane synthase